MQKSRPFLLACSNRWIYLCITNFIPTKNSIEKFDGTQNNDSYCLAKQCAPPDLVILLFHDPLQLQPKLSCYREVPRWEIFMEQELRFGPNLGRMADFPAFIASQSFDL